MNRCAAPVLFVVVTPLLAVYGSSWWSFVAGPAAAFALHLLQMHVDQPSFVTKVPGTSAWHLHDELRAPLIDH